MPLSEEIEAHRQSIRSDGYSMSVGELANLYRDGELDVHPEFQRFYRWSARQKSRLIESLLLGIPIPSIFVAQRDDGVWDVVDGVQRLSTIFELMGILREEDGTELGPLVLAGTRYLPALQDTVWDEELAEGTQTFFDGATQLLIKRAKLDVKILLPESSQDARYELFQRLNALGSPLSQQELRNSVLISVNRSFFDWMSGLANDAPFKACISVSERLIQERYDLELIVRFLVFRKMPEQRLSGITDLGEFLTDELVALALNTDYDRDIEESAFRTTFDYLSETVGDDAFRRYDAAKDRYIGAFTISAFEVNALGVGYNFEHYRPPEEALVTRASNVSREIWQLTDFSWSGVRASTRIPKTIVLGRERFGS